MVLLMINGMVSKGWLLCILLKKFCRGRNGRENFIYK